MTDVKKSYSGLQEKHQLPSLDDLEHEYGLIDLEVEKYPLVEVRKRVSEKIDAYCAIMAGLLEGESMISNIMEAKVLDEKTKTEIFDIYKILMRYSRQINILALSYDELDEANFIKEFTIEWDTLKDKIKSILTKLRDSWDTELESNHEILSYLG